MTQFHVFFADQSIVTVTATNPDEARQIAKADKPNVAVTKCKVVKGNA